jgi:hypothetical protein
MNSIEFNNIFFSKLYFVIIFTIYFSTNPVLKDKIKKKLLKIIKRPTKKRHMQPMGELIKLMNRVTQASTPNL